MTITERAPLLAYPADPDGGLLPPFGSALGAAGVAAAWLNASPGPATPLLEWLAGTRLRTDKSTVREDYPLNHREAARVNVRPGTHGYERTGNLADPGGVTLVRVRLVLLMPRIPEPQRTQLRTTDIPAGIILSTCDPAMRRTGRAAVPEYDRVRATADLRLGHTNLIGMAWEDVTPECTGRAAANRALIPMLP